ncbi:hypothetical protein Aeqsu_2558 [Aequorivita sublithincola DSM 14238]|uniref:Uncharacterized protein n=1 Tax=Aequorivita sublithincola (strain DSM 14238 / LMG 21431 / ACAM 643 / 9-3) TaxID=746697 RepID=I3YYE5_AEQSU|nr:hypothetical protein [Aequorivita sublithincola]AFL82013.1 hypothetical protein Aeqsu_2558 [Aequorivita sublithincola DSM 14238]
MTSSEEAMKRAGDVQNLGFVEFTSDLVRNVYKVITDSTLDQLKAYGELVQTVSKPLIEYQKEVTGITFNDSEMLTAGNNDTQLNNYINEVLGLSTDSAEVPLDDTQINVLNEQFTGVKIKDGETFKDMKESIDSEKIAKVDLQKFVYQKLAETTKESYSMLVTILKLGMQKVEVVDGQIHTKLVFHVDSTDQKSSDIRDVESKASNWGVSGSASARWGWGRANVSGNYNSSAVKVRVVNEKSSSAVNMKTDIIGSVTINFRSGSFPSIDSNQ